LQRKILSMCYRASTMVEFFGSHCGPEEGQDCEFRTGEPGKEPMQFLE